jgi:hypothetical protein
MIGSFAVRATDGAGSRRSAAHLRRERGGPYTEGMGHRWPSIVILLTLGLLNAFLSDRFSVGPRWLVFVVEGALVAPLTLEYMRAEHRVVRWLATAGTAIVTAAVAGSALLLMIRLPEGRIPARELLRDAVTIWSANVLCFALWYWEIDDGGPLHRMLTAYQSVDFVFPQLQQDPTNAARWTPGFVDYVFLAFNTSTAFSPTDTLVLSARIKLLMMAQSSISLLVIAVLAARAINTL